MYMSSHLGGSKIRGGGGVLLDTPRGGVSPEKGDFFAIFRGLGGIPGNAKSDDFRVFSSNSGYIPDLDDSVRI